MKRTMLFAFVVSIPIIRSFAGQDPLINVYNRPHQSLNGEWHYIVDPYENGYYNYRYEPFDRMENPPRSAYFMNARPSGKSDLLEYNFDTSDRMVVPGDWNTQKKELFFYEGTIWYKKSFDYTKVHKENRVFLCFGAVNYKAEVYLNGRKLGTHIGGFTPFHFEITELLKDKENVLVVKVDNKRVKEGVPTLNTDWWNYGGITRDVRLVETPDCYIQDYMVQLNPRNRNQISGFIRLSGPGSQDKPIHLSIEELNVKERLLTNQNGVAGLEIDVPEIRYWSPDDPWLYTVAISAEEETVTDKIGFRIIKTEGDNILLNGRNIFLKGICIHEEKPYGGGRANTLEDAQQLLSWVKELGCHYVRLAHYPHNEHMVRMADEMGILVWEEIPVYWTIAWDNESTYRNAQNQLTEMINRDKNRASVIIWSMANETPTSKERNDFLGRLAGKARELDPTRLISAALEQSRDPENPNIRMIDDPFSEIVDVLSVNQYVGWYDGLPDKCREITWRIDQDKPVLISEFGGGAKFGYHGDSLTRWTEEYQEYVYIENLKMISKIPQLRGFSSWILVDFRSPRRPLPGIQDYWNRKGLISDTGEKKKAFFIMKAFKAPLLPGRKR